jgi:hypothetical protein
MSSLGILGQLPLPPLSSLWGDGEAPLFTKCQRSEKAQANEWLINGALSQYHNKSLLSLPRCRNLFCPYCHRERMRKQSVSLKTAFACAITSNVNLSMLTLTVEHKKNAPLKSLLNAVKSNYAKARQGSPFERMKLEGGLIGIINVIEINYTENGWNPHIHSLVFNKNKKNHHQPNHKVSPQPNQVSEFLGNRYCSFLRRDGYAVNENTVDARLVYDPLGLSAYLSKNWFIQSPYHKSPFQLAGEGLLGNAHSAKLFVECYEAMKGMKNAMVSAQLKRKIF